MSRTLLRSPLRPTADAAADEREQQAAGRARPCASSWALAQRVAASRSASAPFAAPCWSFLSSRSFAGRLAVVEAPVRGPRRSYAVRMLSRSSSSWMSRWTYGVAPATAVTLTRLRRLGLFRHSSLPSGRLRRSRPVTLPATAPLKRERPSTSSTRSDEVEAQLVAQVRRGCPRCPRSFSPGAMTLLTPLRCAASAFSLRPPIGSTSPVSVISPVIATSSRTAPPGERATSARSPS